MALDLKAQSGYHLPKRRSLPLHSIVMTSHLQLSFPRATSGQSPVGADGSWDFGGVDTQYGSHRMHTYLAAMIPQLARRIIDRYVPQRGSVLDPFCGGGSVLVEAIASGRAAAGRDTNILAVTISRAKTTYVPLESTISVLESILSAAHAYEGPPAGFAPEDYIEFWFKARSIRELTALRHAIDAELPEPVCDLKLRTLFMCIFSATARDVSLTRRNEIRLRRMPASEIESFEPDAFARFESRAREAAIAVDALPKDAAVDVRRGDVTKLGPQEGEWSAIVCSPPYGDERNGVPYTQFSKSMLLWMGLPRRDILAAKSDTLGWRKDGKPAPSSPALEQALASIRAFPDSVREAVAFYADYMTALQAMASVARERIIIVIGRRVLRDTIFDNAAITVDLYKDIGVQLEQRNIRRLPSKRLPRMRQFGAAIHQEDILVFHK